LKFKDFKDFMGRGGQNIAIAMKPEYMPKLNPNEKKQPVDPSAEKKFFDPQDNLAVNRYNTIQINQQLRDQLTGKGGDNSGPEFQQRFTVLFTQEQIQATMQDNKMGSFESSYMGGKNTSSQFNLQHVETTRGSALTDSERIMRYWRDHKAQIMILTAYISIGAILFAERGYTFSLVREHTGFRRAYGFSVTTTARGAASGMMFNYSLLLVTMCRNIITKLRSGSIFGVQVFKYIPFDEIYVFHKLVANVALFWALFHTMAHFFNFFQLCTQPADNLLCILRELYHFSNEIPTFAGYLFLTVPGLTGVLLLVVLAILHGFSLEFSRRHLYGAFWSTHHVCALLLYVLTVLHGSARILAPPTFWIWMMPPAALFLLDRLITIRRATVELTVVEAELLPSGVTKIVYQRPDDFDYVSGQWIRIACSAISSNEFHAFTMTSSPHERHLMNHIRAVGPWTNALREVYNPKQIRLGALPKIYADGPYGEGHQEWNSFDYAVLVGGGIGVTPFAAILKEIVHQVNQNRAIYMKKCYFFWVCRNQNNLNG
jgi:dual oxidase